MKSTILTLVFTMMCRGAVVSVCATGCTTTSLQAAFDSIAACGDTIQIKSTETQTGNFTIMFRGCAANAITVTSDRAMWLPGAGARITPSHLANMAHITTANSSPALGSALDVMSRPPAGWDFVGIAFTSSSFGSTYSLVDLNLHQATGPSQTSDSITFDRCYFYRSSTYTGSFSGGGTDLQNVIRLDATNSTIKDSFFGDGFWNGIESHGIHVFTNPGPATITNNFITTSSIPIFVGGAVPTYKAYLQNGATVSYNYFWRPWKWNEDPAQPFAADYATASSGTVQGGPFTITNVSNTGVVTIPSAPSIWSASVLTIASVGGCTVANASNWRINPLTSTTFQLLNFPGCNSTYTSGGTASAYAMLVCTKNLGELKWGVGVTWQYNAAENSWSPNQCGSQFVGFTDTLRTEWDSTNNAPSIGTFSMTDTTHITWSGSYRIGGSGASNSNTQDVGICLQLTTGVECHPVASFSGALLVTSVPFSTTGSASWGAVAYAASAQLTNITISHNVWKNVDEQFSVLGISPSTGAGNAGFGKTHTISQNLSYANTRYVTNPKGIGLTAGEFPYGFANPSGYIVDHNTFYNPNGFAGSFFFANSTQNAIQPKFDSSAITNNLFGTVSLNGLPFAGDGTIGTISTANSYFTNSNVKNNGIPGGSDGGTGAIGGNVVSGNIYNSWSDPFGGLAGQGIFKLSPGGAYNGAGADQRDMGLDFDRLPQIIGLKVTAGVTAALLEFDLTVPIGDAGATQPCILEVSASRNLHSDLGTYSVVNDLNPAFFQQPDTSARTNPALLPTVVTGRHVYWPIGQNATVTGNDGAAHSLALAAGTRFYGRLMCYGDSQWFTFQTGGGLSTSVQYPLSATLQVGTTAGTTGVRLQYGPTPALGGSADFALNASGTASVALPLANGSPTYYKLQFLNGSTVTYTGPMAVYLGGA